jgi:hypothetical protein
MISFLSIKLCNTWDEIGKDVFAYVLNRFFVIDVYSNPDRAINRISSRYILFKTSMVHKEALIRTDV